MSTPQEIREQLKTIPYPGFSRDIVSFGLVKDVEVSSTGIVITLAPTSNNREVLEQLDGEIRECVKSFGETGEVEIKVLTPETPQRVQRGPSEIPGVDKIIAVASGKGGVGKSTVATNLALALAEQGARVGLMDADVYGPSVPLMWGLKERPETREDKRIIPIEKFGLKLISLGLFIEDDAPVIWRGPMINKLLTQFFREVEWGELDYLVLDLPPGTGDAQLTITQQVPLAGGVIVTTPQDVALEDVRRGVKMFEQVQAPVLGVIENMSYYRCQSCDHETEIFGAGGGERVAKEFGLPLLGQLPLINEIRNAGDSGKPFMIAEPAAPVADTLRDIARQVSRSAVSGSEQTLPTIH